MNETVFTLIYIAGIFIFIFVIGFYMPRLTRKELVFGIRIPEDQIGSADVEAVFSHFNRRYILSMGTIIAVWAVLLIVSRNPYIQQGGVIILLVAWFGNYLVSHKEMKTLKNERKWSEGKKEVSVVATDFRKERVTAASCWFLLPLAVIVVMAILGTMRYGMIAGKIPVHWNAMGETDRWMDKSWKAVFMLPFIQLFMTAIFFIVNKAIGWSRQQVSVSDPEASILRDRIFRRRWSYYIVFCAYTLTIFFSVIYLMILDVIPFSNLLIALMGVVMVIAFLGGSLTIAFTTGQGGSRVKIIQKKGKETIEIDRNDDRFWKLGIIYFNPDDPSVFLEKRFGVGWTINFGNIWAVAGLILLVAISILLPIVFK